MRARDPTTQKKKKKTRNPNEYKKLRRRDDDDDANVLRARASPRSIERDMYSMHVHETMPFSKISFVYVVNDVVLVCHTRM